MRQLLKKDRQLSFFFACVLWSCLAVGLVGVGAGLYNLVAPAPWDPLGEFPIQRVESTVTGVKGPAAYTNSTVNVVGVKCNNMDSSVTVSSHNSWFSVDPPGTAVEAGSGVTKRLPGCTTLNFQNAIPTEVKARTDALAFSGRCTSVWAITGEETPIKDATGAHGVPRVWTTVNFTLVTPGCIEHK